MANLKTSEKKTKAQSMGLHSEVLTGKTQQKFFNPDEAENFYYFGTYDVDFNKRTEIDVKNMECREANKKIDELMKDGYGTIVIKNPQGKHSLGVGILNKLNLIFEGSLGYFGCGSMDGPIVRINGRVGWSCAENMMAGKVVIEKNAGSCFGAAIRGGDLICKGSVGARTGIDQKGGIQVIIWNLLDSGLLNGDTLTCTGETLNEQVLRLNPDSPDNEVIYHVKSPFKKTGGLRLLGGNLSPENTAILKLAGVERGLENNIFRGKARIFNGEKKLLEKLDNNPNFFNDFEFGLFR